jgi:hypothetical protein
MVNCAAQSASINFRIVESAFGAQDRRRHFEQNSGRNVYIELVTDGQGYSATQIGLPDHLLAGLAGQYHHGWTRQRVGGDIAGLLMTEWRHCLQPAIPR